MTRSLAVVGPQARLAYSMLSPVLDVQADVSSGRFRSPKVCRQDLRLRIHQTLPYDSKTCFPLPNYFFSKNASY
jgi:hypothetical protein